MPRATPSTREVLPLVSRGTDSNPNSPPLVLTIDSTGSATGSATDEDEHHDADSITEHETEQESAKLFRYEATDELDEEKLNGFESEEEQYNERASGEWSGRAETLATPTGKRIGNRRSSHSLTKGQKRRVYGGGIHNEESGQFGLVEVAFMIFSETVGPTPLLMAHAAALLGLSLFLPLLFLIGILSWFSYIVVGVSSRYTGARSWPALASAVFPHRFKLHRLGEMAVSLLVIFCALGRSVVAVIISAEIGCDLVYSVIGEHRPAAGRPMAIALITASWILFPVILLPLLRSYVFRRRSNASFSRLSSSFTFVFYPLALLILGLRLKTLNRTAALSPPPLEGLYTNANEVMGFSIWGGISLIVFSLSSAHNAPKFLSSLARPHPAARSTRNSSLGLAAVVSPDPTRHIASGNPWPWASLLGTGLTVVLQLGWGLVGYLGIEGGGAEGSLFANPLLRLTMKNGEPDNWIFTVELLVLLVIVSGIEGTLEIGMERVRAGFLSMGIGKSERSEERGYARMSQGGEREKERESWELTYVLARVVVVGAVGAISWVVSGGPTGTAAVNVAEVVGAIGFSLIGFLAPSIFFISLFHLRRPRSIFITDVSSPIFDNLLMRKEREVQRKLSGRRVWQDVGVFGGLLPFGVVLLVRGTIALVRKEN